MSKPTAKVDEPIKVFVSYSRKDWAFTERLVEALRYRGMIAKIDTRDLPKLEDWRRELSNFIREADAVVFVVSSHSVNSSVCAWEVEQVGALNKRLAPIVLEPVSDDRIPPAIAKINYVYFDRPDEFESQVDVLAKALQTDLRWVKNHTRLGELAHRWNERGHDNAVTLRGKELEEAERWIASRPRGAPEPTDLHKTFLSESRRAAMRRLRYGIVGSLLVGAVAIGLALFAFSQRRAAEASRTNAVNVLAASDLQRGITALQSDETTSEGMALLARAVRRGQDKRAVIRLWTLLQQRGFWLPTTTTDRAIVPTPRKSGPDEVPQLVRNRFAKFKIKGQERETKSISMSADGKLVFTSVGDGGSDGDVLYRVWRVDGAPVTAWVAPQYKGVQWVSKVKGFLSPDGRFLLLEVLPWRSLASFQLFDLKSMQRIGNEDIEATGSQPQTQDVEFSRLEFVAETPSDSNDLGFLILAVSEKGDATAYRLKRWGPVQLVRNRHSDSIVFTGLDDAHEWLMSSSSDGTVRISAVKEYGDAIGNVLQLRFGATSIQRVGMNGLSVVLSNGEQHAFALHPAVRSVLSEQLAILSERSACRRWDDIIDSPGPETLLTPRGELARLSLRQLSITAPGTPPLMSPAFSADIVLVCLSPSGDRLAITTSDFVTEVWTIDFSRRLGLPLVERRLFGNEHRPVTTETTIISPDGKSVLIASYFSEPPNWESRWFSFWDVESALPLIDRVLFVDHGETTEARMETNGPHLLFVNAAKGTATPVAWLQVAPPASATEWIADFAEAIAGVSLDDLGILTPISDRATKLKRGSRALTELNMQPTVEK